MNFTILSYDSLVLPAILLGIALSIDSFSLAFAMGHRPYKTYDAIKFSLTSGISEMSIFLGGMFLGSQLFSKFPIIKEFDHWIAFTIVQMIAIHMLVEGFQNWKSNNNRSNSQDGESAISNNNFHHFLKIIIASVASSFDAFGVGIGMGKIAKSQEAIFIYCFFILFFASFSTLLGLYLAKKATHYLGPLMHFIGFFVLTIIAINLLKI